VAYAPYIPVLNQFKQTNALGTQRLLLVSERIVADRKPPFKSCGPAQLQLRPPEE